MSLGSAELQTTCSEVDISILIDFMNELMGLLALSLLCVSVFTCCSSLCVCVCVLNLQHCVVSCIVDHYLILGGLSKISA